MTRQLGMWCSSDQTVYPAFGATQRSIQWYNSTVDKATVHRVFDMMLNCFDVVRHLPLPVSLRWLLLLDSFACDSASLSPPSFFLPPVLLTWLLPPQKLVDPESSHSESTYSKCPGMRSLHHPPLPPVYSQRNLNSWRPSAYFQIGLTHQVPELLVVLSDAVGFQRVKEEPQNAHRLLESWKK